MSLLPTLASAGVPEITKPATQPELFVFNNGIVCVKAPCPSFTVVTADGTHLPVASVVLPEGTDGEIRDALHQGGLVVKGNVEIGQWAPNGPGTVVRVDLIIDVAQDFLVMPNGIFCITAPCPSFSAVAPNGEVTSIAGVDLTAFNNADEDLFSRVLGSEVVVKGFIKRGSWNPFGPGDTLVVSKVAGFTQDLQVQSSGIVCAVAPCPIWTVTIDGVEHKASRVDLTALKILGEEKEAEVLGTLHQGATVKGFLSNGSWSPFENGSVLFVTEIVQ